MTIQELASAAAILLATTSVGGAATITVSTFDAATYNGAFGITDNIGEDFEALGQSRGEGEVGASLATSVGTFTSLGGTGTGGSVIGTGTQLALRDGTVFGRQNVVPLGGSWFLDSNDTWGISWSLNTGTLFDRVSFVINDASDVGAFLRITAGNDTKELRTGGRLPNGNARTVEIDFGQAVSSAEITLGNFFTSGGDRFRLNDGFSIDGIAVASVPDGNEDPAPVPLPASVLLLGAALGGLGWAGRHRVTSRKP
ncbi:hypothetical protein So717_39460 [Roseobacter cerasinus]|uniref:PEP-CTERM protein-sorting domain-containing protein n=1 Tax=Roseobacter cerasinus TaxID=2602289 RepID=A0A640VVK3_9RHOB|nr:VPLPA-CTERM sorting domain-containing protein [Roseobacter cerasinus]GFE52193.1 hypothetical protein So717_39460 [Roseobacter cerasinus]